jgi:hypothetical protein
MNDQQINRGFSARRGSTPDPQITICASGYLGPLRLLGAPLYVEIAFSPPPLRLWLRAWLRLSLPSSLRGSTRAKGDQSPPQRRLRAWRFADIPTAPPGQNINAVLVVTLSIFSASLALDACANTSALVRQRFCITSATGIASVPATPEPQTIIPGSALAPQHLPVNRSRAWRSA